MGNSFLYFFELVYALEKAVASKFKSVFRPKEPAFKYFSKHAYERMHCKEYDR